jgi:uncharacterized protein YecE (DUF72 family)
MAPSLFPELDELPPQAARLAPKLRSLAERGVHIGTSSWKYEGWLGSIYTPERYTVRGKFSQKKFEAECLREYARTFAIVGGDFSFYQFPTPEYWARLFGESPEALRFGLKVPEDVTVAVWPTHARYGARAGKINEHFLDPEVFKQLFARPLWRHRDRVATLIFEFGTFAKRTITRPEEFFERLNHFLESLPPVYRYAVEVRNPEYLSPDYFALLARHNAAHVFNAWTRMPTIGDQIAMPGTFTADFTVVRALLTRGRSYEQAVDRFSPYREPQEPDLGTREALREIVGRALRRKAPAFLFVNNRLEGHAPSTIESVVLGCQ